MDYLLSIYIPTYNRCKEVIRQVGFLVDEINGYENLVEIVVNNNCSTDTTELELAPYLEKINYHKNNTNLGIAGNLYVLGNFVRGKYIWIIGDDDYLNKGIVPYVISILKRYEDINLVFLNWGNQGLGIPKYKGEVGYFENAGDMLVEDFMVRGLRLQFSSACIYKKEFWIITTHILPDTDIRKYGCNLFAAMAAAKEGGSYLDKDIWIYNSIDISWEDIKNISLKGAVKSCANLVDVGYTHKQVKSIYSQFCTTDFLGRWIDKKNLNWENISACLSEVFFFFRKVPLTLIKVVFQIFITFIK